ncbi:hypothetical protein PMAYCL1PPCAC_23223, partial [Pristionchus mayeri]
RVTYFPFFAGNCEEGDDLVILTLENEVESNHACLPWLHDITLPPSIDVQSFGWGESKHEIEVSQGTVVTHKVVIVGESYDNVLQQFELGRTDLRCTLSFTINDHWKYYCSEVQNCFQGDSGAGLLTTLYRKTYMLGVLSSGTACIKLRTVQNEAVFTDVRLFAATIDETIGIV